MSPGYDFVERVIGKLKYGEAVNELRREMVSRLEWRNYVSVLYVSIGTGRDLDFLPKHIDPATLDIHGIDISLGMLTKCLKNSQKRMSKVSLVNGCAEDLPFLDNAFDIVFHVGGINFFNDKVLAIKEMLRVAKSGTKLLIADETDDYLKSQYQKSVLSKGEFQDLTIDMSEIENAIPDFVQEKHIEYLWEKKFYCISFRKP